MASNLRGAAFVFRTKRGHAGRTANLVGKQFINCAGDSEVEHFVRTRLELDKGTRTYFRQLIVINVRTRNAEAKPDLASREVTSFLIGNGSGVPIVGSS